MHTLISLNFEERQEFEKKYKDILVNQYTFRTDYNQFEREFCHQTIHYYVSKYKVGKNGKMIPAEIVKYKICFFQQLSSARNFAYDHLNELDWPDISKSVKLKEYFMREFADKLDWKEICQKQKLKSNFIKEMKKYTKKYMKDYF